MYLYLNTVKTCKIYTIVLPYVRDIYTILENATKSLKIKSGRIK